MPPSDTGRPTAQHDAATAHGDDTPRRTTPSAAIPGLGSDYRRLVHSHWKYLPPDVMRGVRERVATLALAVAGIWAIILLLGDVVAPIMGHHHTPEMPWPFPGTMISLLGLLISIVTWLYVRRTQCMGHDLINTALAFQLFTAALVAILENWRPVFGDPGMSWLCFVILTQPAIVPTPPLKTLVVSLAIATMDPAAVWIAHLRGVPMEAEPYLLIWRFIPNYICVGMALIPSTLIAGLGRRVNEARELGSYQIGERIGLGGMGVVYHARHRLLARPAAIKLIRPETLGDGDGTRVALERFHREAQAAALLRSPHTIGLYDFGVTDEGTFYYVMELLDGFDLESLVRRFGPVPAERAITLLRQACHSLGEAHTRGLIHRDIKPSNLFTCRLGLNVDFVKVLDFGLVKLRRDPTVTPGETALLTNPDVTTGTPAYMAPEMALGEKPIDGRADLYSLGCVAYWLVTGRLVFEGETPVQTMLRHLQSEPVPPSQVSEIEIPAELERVILQCLAKRPEDRPSDAMALACALESVPLREPWSTRRAEHWWEVNHPAPAPVTELRPPTPAASVRMKK